MVECFRFNKMGIGCMKFKKGDITIKNLIGLIIAAAAVFILFMLFFKLMAPAFDVKKTTADSFFSRFEEGLEEMDGLGVGELSLSYVPNDKNKYFLVNFGNTNLVKDWEFNKVTISRSSHGASWTENYKTYIDFFLAKKPFNTVCVCSVNLDESEDINPSSFSEDPFDAHIKSQKLEATCDNCKDLDYEAEFLVVPTSYGVGKDKERMNDDLDVDLVIRLSYNSCNIIITKKSGKILFDEECD